jgi:peptide/nickel transport system permease protein
MPYLLRRLLLALPTLWIISVVIFGMSRCQPTDPVLAACGEQFVEKDPLGRSREYADCAQVHNQHGPAFYLSWTSAAFPDTLHRIYPMERRKRLKALCAQQGNWPAVQALETAYLRAWYWCHALPDSVDKQGCQEAIARLGALARVADADTAYAVFAENFEKTHTSTYFQGKNAHENALAVRDALQNAVAALRQPRRDLLYRPTLHWHGTDNQYHRWVSGFVRGDFGRSHVWDKPVRDVLGRSVWFTLSINILALGLAYVLAIPLGIALARRQGSPAEHWARRLLLFFYTVPSFVLGALLMYCFATPHGGFSLLRGVGFEDCGPGVPVPVCLFGNLPQLLLPVLTLSLHLTAFLVFQFRKSLLQALGSDYVRTARAKGVPEEEVLWVHARRNALVPVVATLAQAFPSMFAGSMLIEYLFNYPGLGSKLQTAMSTQDYPVLFAILMMAAALTVLMQFLADVLYQRLDPTVRYVAEEGV